MSAQNDDPQGGYGREGYGRGYAWGGYGWGGPYRGRGFATLFGGPHSDQHLRVSDAERQAVADRLSEHFAAGRLDQTEFDERVGQAMNAKTRADLNGLFADLPDTGAPQVPGHPGYPRRRHRHPVLLIALLVVAAIAAAHVLWWTAVPLLWLAFLVIGVAAVTRHVGGARPGR